MNLAKQLIKASASKQLKDSPQSFSVNLLLTADSVQKLFAVTVPR